VSEGEGEGEGAGEGEGEGKGLGDEHGSVGGAGSTGVGPARCWEDA